MKKVALMGLCNYENMGDQIIARTLYYLIRTIDGGYEPYYVNFQPERIGYKYEKYKSRRKKVENKGLGQLEHKLIYLIMKDFVAEYYKENLQKADALIFSCGSFKYGTQNLWTTYSIAVEYAQKYNVPVMFDAMNIQDYNGKDWRCRFLKKHANYDCVKMISSRDGDCGVRKLEEYYIEKSGISLLPVGDPAFWVKECYGIEHSPGEVIGINLIRNGIFKDYGADISDERLMEFYYEIIKALEEKGYKWEFFTNGMKKDKEFGENVMKKYGIDIVSHKIKVPATDRELVEIIAGYKAIVGARLHACITAYSLDIPFSGFYWDKKMIHFAEEAEIKENFCTLNELNGEKVVEKLENSMKTRFNEDIRNDWKEKTRQSLIKFLGEYCK